MILRMRLMAYGKRRLTLFFGSLIIIVWTIIGSPAPLRVTDDWNLAIWSKIHLRIFLGTSLSSGFSDSIRAVENSFIAKLVASMAPLCRQEVKTFTSKEPHFVAIFELRNLWFLNETIREQIFAHSFMFSQQHANINWWSFDRVTSF